MKTAGIFAGEIILFLVVFIILREFIGHWPAFIVASIIGSTIFGAIQSANSPQAANPATTESEEQSMS